MQSTCTFIHTLGRELEVTPPPPFTPNSMRIRFQLLKNRLEYFLAGLRASTQEERGDTRLNNARASIRMHEAYIAPADLRIIYEGINL